ncbi:hypothetical protein HN588_13330 [Candidatus Bathyarchaeota archaeon]|jgi:hypothetical protein|nr:hypothetical protein [Candidatus Bathyarchaeota archaeon]
MAKAHNKKRNVGIVYEQLLRYISRGVVNDDRNAVRRGAAIIKKHFKPETELYREFRLFNALVKTQASSETVAKTIISEARQVARVSDAATLDREKSMLIRSINHDLGDASFYHQRIPEYKMLATIQTLLNDWRGGPTADIARLAEFETKVNSWLLQEKVEPDLAQLGKTDADSLVVRIMSEKLNDRYNKDLNSEQKEIVRSYTLMNTTEDKNSLVGYLKAIREGVLEELGAYLEDAGNQVLNEKADRVRRDIEGLTVESLNDETITRFMTISQLRAELKETDR